MAGAVAVARRHGFSGTEAQRGARDRDGVRGAADAAGAAGGRDLRQLSRGQPGAVAADRSEEHTSELQSLMRISYAVFCLKKKQEKTKKHIQKLRCTQV